MANNREREDRGKFERDIGKKTKKLETENADMRKLSNLSATDAVPNISTVVGPSGPKNLKEAVKTPSKEVTTTHPATGHSQSTQARSIVRKTGNPIPLAAAISFAANAPGAEAAARRRDKKSRVEAPGIRDATVAQTVTTPTIVTGPGMKPGMVLQVPPFRKPSNPKAD
ncbi:hypothetical protein FKW77_001836 [Venturia effusa]|uniref:Uncharacterized protein n=1 Tax=Venturia effusa TaxID=50376 RepID=A0A517LRI9_9PEZI|nr:hypothetical protein FKW77_001836 [Venturia effusa]